MWNELRKSYQWHASPLDSLPRRKYLVKTILEQDQFYSLNTPSCFLETRQTYQAGRCNIATVPVSGGLTLKTIKCPWNSLFRQRMFCGAFTRLPSSVNNAPLVRLLDRSSIVVDERPAVDHRRAGRMTWSVPPSGVEQLAGWRLGLYHSKQNIPKGWDLNINSKVDVEGGGSSWVTFLYVLWLRPLKLLCIHIKVVVSRRSDLLMRFLANRHSETNGRGAI